MNIGSRAWLAFVLALALCAAGSLPVAAQTPPLPDTPAAKRMAKLLGALEAGGAASLLKFVQENYAQSALAQRPAAARASVLGEIAAEHRGFLPRRVVESSETRLILLTQDRLAGDWFRLNLEVEAAAPHGILGLGLRPETAPEDLRPRGKLSDAEIAAQVKEYVENLVAVDSFSGAVLVSRAGRPVFQGAYGLASQAFRAPNRVDTKFNLGSMNKMVTSVAIAQLAEQGKLSFEDKVGRHLPELPNAAIRDKVTIHQLLTHTSGVGDYFNEKYVEAAKERFRTVDDFLKLFVERPLHFEPGSNWRYSNGGFMLLGAIVEKASGQNYFDYVREHIYKPAGMTNTDAYEMDRDTPNLAIGYTRSGPAGPTPAGQRYNNLYLHVVKGGPAGGGFSTVEDLVRFARALRSGKLISAKSFELITTGKVSPGQGPSGSQYAYGFQVSLIEGGRLAGHGGGFSGINGQLDIYLDGSDADVAVLSNYDPPAATRVAQKIRALLLQR